MRERETGRDGVGRQEVEGACVSRCLSTIGTEREVERERKSESERRCTGCRRCYVCVYVCVCVCVFCVCYGEEG